MNPLTQSDNRNRPVSGFQELSSELDNIYNSYSQSSHNHSVDTLDSQKDQAPTNLHHSTSSSNRFLQSINQKLHISSRLSSIHLDEDENITRSAPETPNSSSSFDFTPRPHSQHHALTNSSLNVLLDTPTTDAEFKQLFGSPLQNESGIEDDDDDDDDNDDDEWDNKGAAVKQIKDANNTKIIRRGVSDFQFGKQLGEGSYSTVILGTDKHTSKQYAVKILDKRHIIKEKKVKYVNIEKHALNRLSNRMGVISLYFTFQDKSSLYFVLDYASNGELLSLIKRYGTLSEDCTRHFGAQILDAIKYMHDNGVIHRDIKPENILLDDKLRIQITDFGTARLLEKKNDESEEYPVDVRAKSFVGTAEYVSPELLENKYCGKPGDVWAFGCIIYQMIAGKPPFKATNEYLTFQKITKLQFAFSAGFPNIVRDLIKQILVLQPSKRATIQTIQNHYFFQGINFDDFDSIWYKDPPELGPYKMTAKSMMKIPELSKSASQVTVTKKIYKRPTNNNSNSDVTPLTRRALSENNTKLVNPASVAAFVLNKKDGVTAENSEDSSNDSPNESEPVRATNSSSSNSVTPKATPTPDYIPGTNILRPTINTRQNYSRSITQRKASNNNNGSSKPKSRVMDVAPLSTLEAAWSQYLKHGDERILKLGPVLVHREPTESFERKNKGSLHDSPLGYTNKLSSSVAPPSRGSSLLTQVVKGSTAGLRHAESMNSDDSYQSADETDAIIDYFEIEETGEGKSNSLTSSTSSNTRHRGSSLLKRLGFSHIDKKDNSSSDSSSVSGTPTRQHALEKTRTCTMVITTHGRALIFFRDDKETNYRLISEVKLKYPFIQFKELVSSSNKFQKLLPSTGIFAIESSNTTLVFEVEKYEVTTWTEALAKAKYNQLEREFEMSRTNSSVNSSVVTSNTNNSSPKLQDSPSFASISQKRVPSDDKPRRPDNGGLVITKRPTTPTTPISPTIRAVSDSSSSSNKTQANNLMNSKIKIKVPRRKPPPPMSPINGVNMHTGLAASDSNESGMLHAAQLAVSNNAHIALTNNRRSSFTKDDLSRVVSPSSSLKQGIRTGRKAAITSMNSKLLARSQRKK
ncbi:hypothetical protein DFJ63DRAFT_284266 [Scheffersomyces coipomensis]|uniref:uncharacterized protein n=1 Tax=Scheffersomyces coipomensis TaxID=1788519 RepID=UPI00315CAD85